MKILSVDLSQHHPCKPAVLTCYIMDEITESGKGHSRPAMIVLAGGGYQMLSEREKEPILMKYLAEGFNCFLLEYSTLGFPYPTQINQLGSAVAYLRKNAKELLIDPEKIAIIGCSAGGHLCASYSCLYDTEVAKNLSLSKEELKVSAVVLAYPVISGGIHAHDGSFESLTDGDKTLREKLSCENMVGKQTPPTFIFHTVEDQSVPVENSLLYAAALQKHKIKFELHIFPRGKHGLSTCENDVAFEDRGWSYVEKAASEWLPLSFEFLQDTLKFDKFLDNVRGISRFSSR